MPLLTAGPSRFLGGGGVAWLLRDEFTTDLAAGSLNGTAAEPGPGTRTVVDTGAALVISSGKLTWNAVTGVGDPRIYYADISMSRAPGRFLVASLPNLSASARGGAGFGTSSGTTSGWGNQGSNIAPVNAITATIATVSATNLWLAVALRATGAFYFMRADKAVGAVLNTWVLWFVEHTSTTTPLVAAASPRTSSYGNIDSVRIPDALWLPTPLVSDGFATTFGTSDGLGHAEGIATGIGAGGGGVTWTGATWSVSGGKAINTPVTFGAEAETDGGLEGTYTAGLNVTLGKQGAISSNCPFCISSSLRTDA